jgi:hypothetical protein
MLFIYRRIGGGRDADSLQVVEPLDEDTRRWVLYEKVGLWKTVSAFLIVLHTYLVTTVFNFWKRSLSGCATVSAFLTVLQ